MKSSEVPSFAFISHWERTNSTVPLIEYGFASAQQPYIVLNVNEPIDQQPTNPMWVNLGKTAFIWQVEYAMRNFNRELEYLIMVTGDIGFPNWNAYFERARSVIKKYSPCLYAPRFTNEPWVPSFVELEPLDEDPTINISTVTDAMLVFIRVELIEFMIGYFDFLQRKSLKRSDIKIGWGIDIMTATYAIYNGELVIRDSLYIVTHPAGTSYSKELAQKELGMLLFQFIEYCESIGMDGNRVRRIIDQLHEKPLNIPGSVTLEDFYPNGIKISRRDGDEDGWS